MNRHITENIMTGYNRKRLKAASDADKRRSALYLRLPELESIDKEIKLTGIRLSKLVLAGEGDLKEQGIKLRVRLDELKERKKKIFKDNAIPANYLEPVYSCNKCSDTGYTPDGKRCSCFNKQIISELYRLSNMSAMLEKENFDTFDINVFENIKKPGESMTPRQNMYLLLDICEDFCQNFDSQETSLLFYGGTGLGKTFMCNCIAKYLMDNRRTVMYQTAFSLFEIIENHKFNRQTETEENRISYEMMFDSDLLIIDDLGTEIANSFTNAELFNILNARMISNKRSVISTNLSMEKLGANYSDRIMSRIFSKFLTCKFIGKDLRL